jgi:hypothetical protein
MENKDRKKKPQVSESSKNDSETIPGTKGVEVVYKAREKVIKKKQRR